MRPVRALPTPLMSGGQLPRDSCRPACYRPALKERAAARAWGTTPSSIISPGHVPADQDKAGRLRARTIVTPPPPAACPGVVTVR